jgi:hypothetical protein
MLLWETNLADLSSICQSRGGWKTEKTVSKAWLPADCPRWSDVESNTHRRLRTAEMAYAMHEQ